VRVPQAGVSNVDLDKYLILQLGFVAADRCQFIAGILLTEMELDYG